MRSRRPTRSLLTAARSVAHRACESLENRRLFNNTYHNLSTGAFSQNWENPDQITANDDWSGVPSVIGYLGDYDNRTSNQPTNVDPQTLLFDDLAAGQVSPNQTVSVDVVANVTATPASQTSGGVYEFALAAPISTSGNNTIAMQGSGTADAPYLKFFLNATGRSNIQIAYDLIDIDGAADNAVQQFALQFRTSSTGTWTNVPEGYVADASTGPSLTGNKTSLNVTLPPAANNSATLEVRVITTNAGGSDEFVAVDNVIINSTGTGSGPGAISFIPATYGVSETVGTTNLMLQRTQTTGAVSATYTITQSGNASIPGDASGPGGVVTGTVTFADGVATATIPITIVNDTAIEPTETFTVVLTAPTGGATISGGTATVSIADDDTPPPPTISFSASNYFVNENDGSVTLTVNRVGTSTGEVTALYTIGNGTTQGASDYLAPGESQTGAVVFADGQTTFNLVIPIVNDTVLESQESFFVTLSAPTGAVLGAPTSPNVIIYDNDFVQTTSSLLINEINIDTAGNNNPFGYVEIRGTPGTVLGGVYIVALEGDAGSVPGPGSVDHIVDLTGGVIGANGILLVKSADGTIGTPPTTGEQGFQPVDPQSGVLKLNFFLTSSFEVGSNSFLLLSRPANSSSLPAVGTDLDAQDTPVDHATDPKLGLEGLPSDITLFDAVGVSAGNVGDAVYGAATPKVGTGAPADMVIRAGNNSTPFDVNAYYGGSFTGANNSVAIGTPTFGTVPAGATLTPGGANPASVVVDTTAPTVSSIVFDRFGVKPKITVTFSEDVRNASNGVLATDFTLVNNTTSTSIPPSALVVAVAADGKSAVITFNNAPGAAYPMLLANGNYTLTVNAGSIADLAGNVLAANATGKFNFVNGDITGETNTTPDGKVGFDDLVIIAQNYLQPGVKTFAQGDLNYDGTVNFDDLVLLAQNYNTNITPAPLLAPPSKGPAVVDRGGKKSFGSTLIS